MQKKIIKLITIFSIFLTTFAYSALATSMSITSEVKIRPEEDIRVTGVTVKTGAVDAVIQYESEYSKDTITNGFKLNNTNSQIQYEVEIENFGDKDYIIYDILTQSSNNNGINYTISGYNYNKQSVNNEVIGVKDKLTITITYTSTIPGTIDIINKFDFRKVSYVSYNANGGSNAPSAQKKIENIDLTLTTSKPIKTGYVFEHWNTKSDNTGVSYQSGGTYTIDEDKILYANYKKGESTFVNGETFNKKIKVLANTGVTISDYTYVDSNITSIQRSNTLPANLTFTENNIVSTSTSDFPIYAWFNNGTIYYYTESIELYMNSDASSMFRELTKVTSIDVSTIDTNKTSIMMDMFYNDLLLNSLDVSNFDTSNVSDMSAMFIRCTSLTSLNMSNFNTSKVITMRYMFGSMTNLTNLDLSNFDMSSITTATDMLSGMTSLKQIKTPNTYPLSVTITLPDIYYDSSNNSYTILDSNSPTEEWIKLPYTIVFNSNGGTGTMNNQRIPLNYTETLSANTFTRTGYTFNGWNTEEDGSGTSYNDKDEVINLKGTGETITLYAKWNPNPYTIIFNKNDGEATGTMDNQSTTYDTDIQLIPNRFKKTGYKFIEWNTKQDGTGTSYTDKQNTKNVGTGGNVTLYAQWRRVNAENIYQQNQDLNCTDVQCIIDEIYYMLF